MGYHNLQRSPGRQNRNRESRPSVLQQQKQVKQDRRSKERFWASQRSIRIRIRSPGSSRSTATVNGRCWLTFSLRFIMCVLVRHKWFENNACLLFAEARLRATGIDDSESIRSSVRRNYLHIYRRRGTRAIDKSCDIECRAEHGEKVQ